MNKLLTLVTSLGILPEQVPSKHKHVDAIKYTGNGVFVTITPIARKVLEDFGYSFPIKNGKLMWCLNSDQCVELDVSEEDEHLSLLLNIKDARTLMGGVRVVMYRGYTMKNGKDFVSHHIFDPKKAPDPFPHVSCDHKLIKKVFG